MLGNRKMAAMLGVCAALSAGAAAQAGVSIGLNFNASNSGRSGAPYNLDATPPGLTAGVISQDSWNDLSGNSQTSPSAAFHDSTGVVTTATATWSGADTWGVYGSSQSDPNLQLLNGYLDNHHQTNSPAVLTVSNIPYSTYEVIAYVNSDHLNTASNASYGNIALSGATTGNGTYYYTAVGPVSYTAAQLTAGAEYIQTTATSDALKSNPVADYAIFTGVTGSSFTLTNSAEGAAGTGDNTGLTGIQIVETSAVPEPSTVALTAVGVLGLMLIKRRKAATAG